MKKYEELKFNFQNTDFLSEFLFVLYKYDNFVLTDNVIFDVAKTLIQKGLYQPTKHSEIVKEKWKNEIELTDKETETVFEENPQSHKEAGFERGWASRFDTWYKLGKELGFVYYWQNEKIEFSESGKMLLGKENPQNEQFVFVNAFAKFYRHNPFKRVLNQNVPLVLLLETIQLLNQDKEFNNKGISKKELPILLCWKNNNAQNLYVEIKNLRQKYAYTPSNEVILDICYSYLDETKRDDDSILTDYPDDFIRKMRLTGLISVRGAGRFIDINTKELNAVNYILVHYKKHLTHSKEKDFFDYIGTIDNNLLAQLTTYKNPIKTTKKELQKWVDYFEWDILKHELLLLSKKGSSKNEILRIIENPLRLEFLTTLAILKKLPYTDVKPNFIADDEGLPVSFAQGGMADIECFEGKDTILVEVTLLTGTQQHIRESFSVQRHLEDYLNKKIKAFSLFISPKVFVDTCRYAKFIAQDGFEIKILDIDLFVIQLEKYRTLQQVAYQASSCF
ncbi:MAG: AlwI family type II restriction endonuclease [Bacteroidetes bacterium]|nr:MAG: AlwI family type II restriction endonuclease [Bacteroidota bacterium]TAG87946.1 MAG: AlwI family type II restriction endonuclease [Bacteroidota bacterium]